MGSFFGLDFGSFMGIKLPSLSFGNTGNNKCNHENHKNHKKHGHHHHHRPEMRGPGRFNRGWGAGRPGWGPQRGCGPMGLFDSMRNRGCQQGRPGWNIPWNNRGNGFCNNGGFGGPGFEEGMNLTMNFYDIC